MVEYIEREKAIKGLDDITSDNSCPMFIAAEVDQWMEYIPAADVEPVRHGYWQAGYFHDRVCSCCCHPDNDLDDFPHLYCPNCGAKMDKRR